MEKFEVLNVQSPSAGVASGPCDGYQRTSWLYVTNDTQTAIKLCLFQVKCSFANELPDPYIGDTGVFVGGVDLPAGADCHADPCGAGGRNKPIAGTWGACSVLIRHPNGQEQTINFQPHPEAGPGRFYPAMGW